MHMHVAYVPKLRFGMQLRAKTPFLYNFVFARNARISFVCTATNKQFLKKYNVQSLLKSKVRCAIKVASLDNIDYNQSALPLNV